MKKKTIKQIISALMIASMAGNAFVCPKCGHTCDDQCTYTENGECSHECGIDPQDLLDEDNPKG